MTSRGDMDYLLRHPQVDTRGTMDFQRDSTTLVQRGARGIDYLTSLESLLHSLSTSSSVEDEQKARTEAARTRSLRVRRARNLTCPTETQFNSPRRATIATSEPLESMLPLARRSKCCDECGSGVVGRWCAWRPPSVVVDLETLSAWAESLVAEVDHMCEEVLLAGTQDQHESSAFPELGSSDKRQPGDEQVHAEGDGNTGPSPTPSSPLHPRDVEKFLQRVENSIRASSRSPPTVRIQKQGPLQQLEWTVSDNESQVFRDFGTQTSLDVSPSVSCTWTSSDGEKDVALFTDSPSAGGLSHKGTQMNPSVESLTMMTSSAEALAPKCQGPRLKDEPTDSDSGSVSVSGPLDGLSAGRLSSFEQLDNDDGEGDDDDDEGEEEEEDVTVSGSPAGFEADDVLSSSSLRDSTPSPTVKADSGDSTAASDSLWHRRGPCDPNSGFQTVPKMRLKMATSSNCQPVGSSQPGCSPFPLVRYDFGKASSAPVLDSDVRNRRGSRHRQRNPGENGDGNCGLLASSSSSSTSSSSSRRVNHAYYKDFTAPRYHSAKVLTELEAVEACKWLRAAGFPQYAQMFEDQHFPIDISSVQKDHYFLDEDSLQSLFRRLNALNRCARMRLDGLPHKRHNEDSDDDEQCALSEHWKFQRHSRRWSRIPGFGIGARSPDDEEDEEDEDASPPSSATPVSPPAALTIASTVALAAAPTELSCASSYDSVLTDVFPRPSSSATSSPKPPPRLGRHPLKKASLDGTLGLGGEVDIGAAVLGLDLLAPPKDPDDQWGPEKKSGAKSILRRMGSLRSRRSKHKHKDLVVTVESEDPGNGDNLPRRSSLRLFNSGRSRSRTSDNRGSRRGCALSDSECSPPPWRHGGGSGQDAPPLIEHFLSPRMPRSNRGSRSGSIVAVGNTCGMLDGESSGTGVNHRTGSFNLGEAGNAYRERFLAKKPVESDEEPPTDFDRQNRGSIYDNMPIVIVNRGYQDNGEEEEDLEEAKASRGRRPREQSSSNEGDSGSLTSTNQETGSEAETKGSREDVVQSPSSGERRDSGVGLSLSRIASGNNKLSVHWHNAPQHRRRSSVPCRSLPINNLSVVQMLVLRKLALLKLTSLMEKYSPSNRSGWNWVMPKFIKRIKGPDYKDKAVFGVPLLVVLQRTGHPLPSCIQSAIRFLRRNSSEAVGIFRKSGVRSRIQKLKNYNEANPTNGNYEGQQTYDMADMLKQYFRELPEALLTTKFSETFISIYQYLAEEVRFEALQAAVILMPDENREVLQALLSFLRDVSSHASENQMTASNLAVCFAPSLFHMSNLRSQSMSPRRRKTVGVPDQKELNENRAAHECLTQMINDIDRIFSVPEEVMVHCSPPYVEQRDPPSLEELRQRCNGGNWSAYTEACTQWLSKESREKFKGWVSVATAENAELAYMKASDDQLLRWWKTSVEVEAPPSELLHRIIRDRHLWDDNLTKWQVVCCLDKCTEVFQYVCSSMPPLPAHDYCVFRSWRTDLPKNTCVLVEMSVDHLEAPPVPGAVRANVLGSRYLIEPCGSGKSRVTHVTRVDTKGRAPEWYIKAYGQMCALQMARLRESFRHNAEGPESKV